MKQESLFTDFLSGIRIADKSEYIEAHKTLRSRLKKDPTLGSHIVHTFLQGSYRRHTAISPDTGEKADIDVVIVTDFAEGSYTPKEVIELFVPFLEEHYKGLWDDDQARSIGITLGDLKMDMVVTSDPTVAKAVQRGSVKFSESDFDDFFDEDDRFGFTFFSRVELSEKGWQPTSLRIPDRNAEKWIDTDPITQILWTRQMNKDTGGHYVNAVKALKWWKRGQADLPKHPKGYPLEHIIGANCPSNITSVAEGVCKTLRAIVDSYGSDVLLGQTPVLLDHGVNQNVLLRIKAADFKAFYEAVEEAADAAEAAYKEQDPAESWRKWYAFFGAPFPEPKEDYAKSLSGIGALRASSGDTERKRHA